MPSAIDRATCRAVIDAASVPAASSGAGRTAPPHTISSMASCASACATAPRLNAAGTCSFAVAAGAKKVAKGA